MSKVADSLLSLLARGDIVDQDVKARKLGASDRMRDQRYLD
jgi:hypothetical protein